MKKLLIFLCVMVLLRGNVSAADTKPQQNADNPEEAAAVSSPGAALKSFHISRSGDAISDFFTLYRAGSDFMIAKNNDQFFESDLSIADEIVRLMDQYDVWSWDGFNESNPYVLDGEMFSLSADFSDGRSIFASGSNAFPENYYEAISTLERLLALQCTKEIPSIFGTYICEAEGAGGDFTFTLSEDETYQYREGPRSETVTGNWYPENGLLMLTDEETWRSNNLLVGSGKLVYTEEWSDNFQTVQIPEGTSFIKETD